MILNINSNLIKSDFSNMPGSFLIPINQPANSLHKFCVVPVAGTMDGTTHVRKKFRFPELCMVRTKEAELRTELWIQLDIPECAFAR
jgi:hypothetical protein